MNYQVKSKILFVFLIIELAGYATPKDISICVEHGFYFATNVSINNIHVKGKFLIDTGCETSVIHSSIAKKINIPYKNKVQKYFDGSITKELVVGEATLDISFEGVNVKRQRVYVWDNDNLNIAGVCNVVGVIGGDVLRKYVCRFNNGSLSITDNLKGFPKLFEYTKEKLLYKDNPLIPVKYGRPTITSLFDTGYNGFIEVNRMFLNYIPYNQSIRGKGVVANTVLLPDTNSLAIKVDTFQVANLVVENVIAHVSNDNTWTIGTEFFNYFETVFDFPQKRVYLKQINNKYESRFFFTFGFKFDLKEGEIIVTYLWNNSPAAISGIKLGDRIRKINKLDVECISTQLSACEIKSLIRTELEKNNIIIEIIDRQGDIKMHTLEKQKIL